MKPNSNLINVPLPAPATARSLSVPPEVRGPGLFAARGSTFRLKVGDRFIAVKSKLDDDYFYCEVQEKDESGKAQCVILNGGWTLTFNRNGLAKWGDGHRAEICLLLPRNLRGVRNMADYDKVIDVAERQLLRIRARVLATQARSTHKE